MCAWQKHGFDEKDFGQAAREEALRMRDAIVSRIGPITL